MTTATAVDDCRVTVTFDCGIVLAYRAERSVAQHFSREFREQVPDSSVKLDDQLTAGLRRLPCEQLFAADSWRDEPVPSRV